MSTSHFCICCSFDGLPDQIAGYYHSVCYWVPIAVFHSRSSGGCPRSVSTPRDPLPLAGPAFGFGRSTFGIQRTSTAVSPTSPKRVGSAGCLQLGAFQLGAGWSLLILVVVLDTFQKEPILAMASNLLVLLGFLFCILFFVLINSSLFPGTKSANAKAALGLVSSLMLLHRFNQSLKYVNLPDGLQSLTPHHQSQFCCYFSAVGPVKMEV